MLLCRKGCLINNFHKIIRVKLYQNKVSNVSCPGSRDESAPEERDDVQHRKDLSRNLRKSFERQKTKKELRFLFGVGKR